MKKQIILDHHNIEYEIVYSKRKTIGLELNDLGNLKVRVPTHTTNSYVEAILLQKSQWILSKLDEIRNINDKKERQTFLTGSKLRYYGDSYELRVEKVEERKKQAVVRNQNQIVVRTLDDTPESVEYILELWYVEEARRVLCSKSLYYGQILQVKFNAIKINNPKKRWGSCSSKGNINYNWRIIMAPDPVINYLVVHELSHLKQMNHSSKFYQLVGSVLPNYQENMKWLKENGRFLEL